MEDKGYDWDRAHLKALALNVFVSLEISPTGFYAFQS